jgi:replicative DNA helicase
MRELTPEEQAKLELLTDPDVTKTKFAWDETFQKKLLGMLLTDHFMLVQSVDKIKPIYFSSEVHVTICGLLFEYFAKHHTIPERFILHQELQEKLKDREKSIQIYYTGEFHTLYEYYVPGLDTREYLLDKVTYFAKVQAIKVAFHNCLEKMNEAPEDEKTWGFVYEEMRQAMTIDRHYEPGLEYFINIQEMFNRMDKRYEGLDRFTSAFESIDNALTGGGLFSGQIAAWIGLPGTGKSLALVKSAVANVLLGHKVLYLTMEMDELGIAQRFTSQFAKLDINLLRQNKDEVIKTIEEFGKDKDDRNQLIIKQFPGGQMDVNGIRAYYAQLGLRGWKPNLLIIDYVGEMKDDPSVKKYESAYRILRDLRGFGVEKQHCTITCVQPNASAAKLEISQYIDESNIGTSFDQFKPLDAFWSINQQGREKDAEVGRGFIIKHRDGSSRFPFKIGFDYRMGTLDIFEISKERYASQMTNAAEKKQDDFVLDKFTPKKKKEKKNSIIDPQDEELGGQ